MSKNEVDNRLALARNIPGAWATTRGANPVPAKPDDRLQATYARYSTAGQKETSIERQIEVCTEYAKQTGREVVKVYADRARGGASIVGREGLEAMVRDAKAGLFGVVAIENVDRLARDLGIASTVFKTLVRHHVSVHVPGRGPLSLTDIAVQALMGDEGRRLLAERTRFAINEMAREGRFPTGPCFGYRKVPGKPGICAIEPEAAKAVRRVFALRADGLAYRSITALLHAEGTGSRRGGRMTSQGVKGMLCNARYIGLLIHNRHANVKDPDSGKRSVHLRPRSDWIVTEVPEARIVDQDTWDRVRAVQAARSRNGVQPREEQARYLLSGRVACPDCGRMMTVKRTTVYRYWFCREESQNGICTNKRTFSLDGLDRLVLELLAEELSRPGFMEAYAEAYNEERGKADACHADLRAKLQRRVSELTRKVDKSFDDAFTEGFSAKRVAARRRMLEAELDEAEARLAAVPARPPTSGVDASRMTTLRDVVRDLSGQAPFRPRDEAGLKVAAAIRDVVRRVDVKPLAPGRFEASVTLGFGSLIGLHGDIEVEQATRVVTKSCLRTHRGYHVHRSRAPGENGRAADVTSLSDSDWEAVRDLLPAAAGQIRGKPCFDPRPLVETTIRVILTGFPWYKLPRDFGSVTKTTYHAARLLRSPEWDAFAGALAARDPERFGSLPEMSRPFVEWSRGEKRLRRS